MGVTVQLPASRRRSVARAILLRAIAACSAAGLLFALDGVLLRGPTFVDRVAFTNNTRYDVQIELSNGTGSMPLGAAIQHCTTGFHEVIDQGSEWTVRFRSQGRDGGQVTVNRAELEATAWTLVIPDSVAAALEANGAPLPPRQGCSTT